MNSLNVSERQLQTLLDAIEVARQVSDDEVVGIKANKAGDALCKLFDAIAWRQNEVEEAALPF